MPDGGGPVLANLVCGGGGFCRAQGCCFADPPPPCSARVLLPSFLWGKIRGESLLDAPRTRHEDGVHSAQRMVSWLLALGSWLLALGSWLLALSLWLVACGLWLVTHSA